METAIVAMSGTAAGYQLTRRPSRRARPASCVRIEQHCKGSDSLELRVLVLVLLAALIHALWNAWLKVTGDRLAALATLAAGWALVAICAFPFVGLPPDRAWPYLVASTGIHTIYSLALIRAYRYVDLSVAYPIARGTGPVVVAIVSATLLGDALGSAGFLAVMLIAIGVIGLGWSRPSPDRRGVLFSLLTGGLIGTYTLLDGVGGRVGDAPHAYSAWLFLLTSVPIAAVALVVHGAGLKGLARPLLVRGISAGVLSALAYWIVIWAMSISPMGLVAAVRESSVVLAALLGGVLLTERVRWLAVTIVLIGLIVVRLA